MVEDFADTAAVIAQLDLVISVDTAVVHLAGALDRPVWAVLPFANRGEASFDTLLNLRRSFIEEIEEAAHEDVLQ